MKKEEWFEDPTATGSAIDETMIAVSVPDQISLHGLLARNRDLNLTPTSVRPIPLQ